MGDQARQLAPAVPADSVLSLPDLLEAVIRALAGADHWRYLAGGRSRR
jgi:hypothetical protein